MSFYINKHVSVCEIHLHGTHTQTHTFIHAFSVNFFVVLPRWHNLQSSGKKRQPLKMCFHQIGPRTCLLGVSLISNWSGRSPDCCGWWLSWTGGPRMYKKARHVSHEEKTSSCCQGPVMESCPGFPVQGVINYKLRETFFLPKSIWIVIFRTAIKSKLEHLVTNKHLKLWQKKIKFGEWRDSQELERPCVILIGVS